jgi:hypothetical protein
LICVLGPRASCEKAPVVCGTELCDVRKVGSVLNISDVALDTLDVTSNMVEELIEPRVGPSAPLRVDRGADLGYLILLKIALVEF